MKLFIAFTLTIITGAALTGCTSANQTNPGSAKNTGGANAVAAASNTPYPGQITSNSQIASVNQTAPPNQTKSAPLAPSAGNMNVVQVETKIGSGGVLDAPRVAKLSVAEHDKMFGAPLTQQPLANGTKRIYALEGGKTELGISVFTDGTGKEFSVRFSEPRQTADDLLKSVGLDPKGHQPDWATDIVKRYENQSFGGMQFKRVSASMNPAEQVWDRIELQILN